MAGYFVTIPALATGLHMNFKKMSGEVITPEDFKAIPEDLQGVFEETKEEATHWVCRAVPASEDTSSSFSLRSLPRETK